MFAVPSAHIVVAHEEDEQPPPLKFYPSGARDLKDATAYISARADAYRGKAILAMNRLLMYFKVVLNTPNIVLFGRHPSFYCNNPDWLGPTGKPVQHGLISGLFTMSPEPGNRLLDQKCLTPAREKALTRALGRDLKVTPAQEFLAEAWSSLKTGRLVRATLEMAIACEVGIKHTFFDETTPAGAAYAYLEGNRRVNVRVIELLDGAAQEAFGESFKAKNPLDYEHLDQLFQCRNKIAHRAVPQYRDAKKNLTKLDKDTLKKWWASVDELFTWLVAKRGRMP